LFIGKSAPQSATPSSRGSPAPNTASPRALGAAGAALLSGAMASMFTEGDWGTCATLLAAGGVGALVSCACAMADDEPTAEDAAAAWGAQQDPRRAATVTWDGDKHPPAPTHKADAPRFWGEEVTARAKTAPAGAPEATATVTPAAAAPAPAAKTSFWGASDSTPDAAPAKETRSFWAASASEPEEPLAEPVTFEQATGAARLEAARRCRAAEVTESERQFMREFTAMMAAGLVVVLRVDSDGVAVTLSLQEFRNEPILEWHFTENGERGRLSLSDIQTVRGQQLNDDLARRSFVIEGRDRVLVFHCETPDICALVVDGLAMLVADHKRRAARRRSSLGPARKAIAARRSSPKKPLAAKN
jgi:hypothetical protein